MKGGSVSAENNNLQEKKRKQNKTIAQDFGDYKVLNYAIRQPGLFTPVVSVNGIIEYVRWYLTCYFFQSGLTLDGRQKNGAKYRATL